MRNYNFVISKPNTNFLKNSLEYKQAVARPELITNCYKKIEFAENIQKWITALYIFRFLADFLTVYIVKIC